MTNNIRCKYNVRLQGPGKILGGSTYERILKHAVFFEDRHSKWDVLFDYPLNNCLMGVLLAIMGECEFQRLAGFLHRDFSHLDFLVVNSMMFENNFVFL